MIFIVSIFQRKLDARTPSSRCRVVGNNQSGGQLIALAFCAIASVISLSAQTWYTNVIDVPTNAFSITRSSCPSSGYSIISICSDFGQRNDTIMLGDSTCPWTNFSVPFGALRPGTNIIMVSDVDQYGTSIPFTMTCTAPGIYAWFNVVYDGSNVLNGPYVYADVGQSAFWSGKVIRTDWNPKPYYEVQVLTTNPPVAVKPPSPM